MLRSLRIAATILAMVLVTLLAAGITLRLALHAGEVSIPNFSGLTVGEASDAALRAGLDMNIANKFYSTTIPAGRIMTQAPAPGSEVRRGWQVRVTESLGPQQVSIPDVVGEPVREATMDLRRNQLDLGTQAHINAPGDADLVLAQTPPPNAGVDQPRVNLLLSSRGQDSSSGFVMPSFVGESYTTAAHQIIALGLRVASIGGTPAAPANPQPAAPDPANPEQAIDGAAPEAPAPAVSSTPAGPILSQWPEPGHFASPGITVRLYFNRSTGYQAPAVANPSTTVTVPNTPSEQ